MKSHHLKILFVGRSSAVCGELIRLLQGAGYVLTTERQATRGGGGGSAKQGQSKGPLRAVIRQGVGVDPRPDASTARRSSKGRLSDRGDAASTGSSRAMNLRGLRESVGKTQDEIARKTSISQSQLSRVEGRRDHLISTLRRYVKGLGGEIEVCAVFDETRVVLRDV